MPPAKRVFSADSLTAFAGGSLLSMHLFVSLSVISAMIAGVLPDMTAGFSPVMVADLLPFPAMVAGVSFPAMVAGESA